MTPPWNGYNQDGTPRLECAAAASLEAGAFMGQTLFVPETNAKIPTFSPGTGDLCVEMVIRHKTGDSNNAGADPSFIAGSGREIISAPTSGNIGAGIRFARSPKATFSISWRWNPNPEISTAGEIASGYTWTTPETWTHHACNFDRDGNMQGYLRGVATGTPFSIAASSAIDAQDWGIYPIIGRDQSFGNYDDLGDDFMNCGVIPHMIAEFAIHARLLTGPELTANAAANVTGSYAETVVRYDFANVFGVSTKTTDLDHLALAPKWTVPSPWSSSLYAPTAADGTVYFNDLTSNNRDYYLSTALSYNNSALANRAQVALSSDPAP